MQCVGLNWIPLSDGSTAVVLSPEFVEPGAHCSLVAVSYDEWVELQQKAGASPFALSVDDALVISGAIVTLWCVAWAVRAVRRAL